ncbi:Hypothetical predicted protein [Xyrichtys novacula]|uniref:Uncharacterized protein n=1 Tax=Xyrichtys novacula TaxID=13765 RepID=A0AAV1G5E1_XYRNO|nr:Hypothetical predicted protein [Xyrichtys novacula]
MEKNSWGAKQEEEKEKGGAKSKTGVLKVKRDQERYQEEAEGSETAGHDEPDAFTLRSQSEDEFQACHWALLGLLVMKFTC